jgi:hypothetical protein
VCSSDLIVELGELKLHIADLRQGNVETGKRELDDDVEDAYKAYGLDGNAPAPGTAG